MPSKYTYSNLYQIIEEHAKKIANNVAIYDGKLKITYKQLKLYSDKVAEFLHSADIKYGDKVGLIMANSWQFVINLFAISKIGAIVVPINNFLKADELAYIVNDSHTKLIFASGKFATDVKDLLHKSTAEQIVWVDGVPLENENNIDYDKIIHHRVSHHITPMHPTTFEDTACIVYTSGTTGKPKGAMLSFKNLLSNCSGSLSVFDYRGHVNMLCYLPMFHAFTLTANVLLPLYAKGSIVVIRSISTKKDFKYLLKQLLIKRCPFFTGIPDVYNALSRVKLPWYFHWFHNVKGFVSGAAPISEETMNRFSTQFKRGALLQGYGISECSPIVSCNSAKANRFGSVGRPLSGYMVKIVDDDMHELSIGEIGEICVKGDCVMQGYYNRPEETAEAIVDGWFKTGDLGKVDADGYIYIVDRKKDLIIHKGMNIYPREIEEILLLHEAVQACAVIGIKDKDEQEVPVAYIEIKENAKITEHEIKEFLKSSLATFKLPRKIIFIDKIPRNATGKILKRELREMHKQ